jgi:hypothetical protein
VATARASAESVVPPGPVLTRATLQHTSCVVDGADDQQAVRCRSHRWLEDRALWLPGLAGEQVGGGGEAMGMGFNALVLTTIRCTSGRERNAVTSMVGRDPR